MGFSLLLVSKFKALNRLQHSPAHDDSMAARMKEQNPCLFHGFHGLNRVTDLSGKSQKVHSFILKFVTHHTRGYSSLKVFFKGRIRLLFPPYPLKPFYPFKPLYPVNLLC